MADAAKTVNETLAIIDSALTITNNYPKLDKKDLEISTEFSMSISPISYLVELLKHVEGYDALIKIVAKFIVAALPALELSVKAILLTNIKNMLSCSLDPLIPYEVLKNGIVVDLRKLDVLNIIERHIGAGITKKEAEELNLFEKSYVPETLEEKIVAHADNLISGTEEVDIDFVIKKWKTRMDNPEDNIKRLIKLDEELIQAFKDE